jgi:hypothetical protein
MMVMAVMAVMSLLAGLAGAGDQLEVRLDRDEMSVVRGDQFTTESTITNRGAEPTTPLKVHLNVASLTGQVSVDPEDWTASPIRDLPALAPGESTSMSWEIRAGDIGSFALYLVFLPAEPGGTSVSSTPMYVQAAGQNTLDAAGTLPVVVTIPVLLGAAAATARWRFRRAG